MSVAENIRKRRKAIGMSQQELAELVGYANKSMICRIEKGMIDLPQSQLSAIARALDTTPSSLMGWFEKTDSSTEIVDTIYRKMKRLNPDNLKVVSAYIDFLIKEQK